MRNDFSGAADSSKGTAAGGPARYAAGMNEERFIDLETRLSYQDETLRSLSDTVARQQKQLDQQENLCRQLLERLKSQPEPAFRSNPADEVPPHY